MRDIVATPFYHFLDHMSFELARTHRLSQIVSLVCAAAFAMFFSVVALHAFIPAPQPLSDVLVHGLAVALTYTFTIIAALLLLSIFSFRSLMTWHVWLLSLLIYVIGFSISQYADSVTSYVKFSLHPDLEREDSLFHFLRLVPVWIVMTYLFVSQLQRQCLQSELEQLAEINRRLSGSVKADEGADNIIFESGKATVRLSPNVINTISVDDHYCSIHVDGPGGPERHDVALSLTMIEALLPDQFKRVHRSHIVNLVRVRTINRRDRNLTLTLGDAAIEVPVSRSRVSSTLQQLSEIGASPG